MYATLAALCALHEEPEGAHRFIRHSVDNLLAYGNHKDMLLYECLEVTELCHEAGQEASAQQWLIKLATPIASITRLTTGDETSNFPETLADAMVKIMPHRLPSYYVWLSGMEEFQDAEYTLHLFLQHASLVDPFNSAIAATCVDSKSFSILSELAYAGKNDVTSILSDLTSRIGKEGLRDLEEDDGASSNKTIKKEAPAPENYPPERFEEFRSALNDASYYFDEENVNIWAQYWSSEGRAQDAYKALLTIVAKRRDVNRYCDSMYGLTLNLYGKEEAYKWLVEAHRQTYGWNRWFTSKADAENRWIQIQQRYPQRWFQFIRDTFAGSDPSFRRGVLISGDHVPRLVEYCIRLGKIALACKIGQVFVSFAIDLVSPAPLPTPGWLKGDDGT